MKNKDFENIIIQNMLSGREEGCTGYPKGPVFSQLFRIQHSIGKESRTIRIQQYTGCQFRSHTSTNKTREIGRGH